jgi:uncharacterized protein (TIGR00369 family)
MRKSSPEHFDMEKPAIPGEHLRPMDHTASNRCFGCGEANSIGLHLEFFLAEDNSVVCFATIPDSYEGPRGHLHGGIIATLLDEAMSKSVRAHGVVAMTRHMEVDYLQPVPSGSPIRLEGRVTHNEGRKHWTQAMIRDAKGIELAKSKGLFVEVNAKLIPRR